MPQGYFYNTWLTVSQDLVSLATGLCSSGCNKRFIPVIPSHQCGPWSYGIHCYPVLDQDVIFDTDQLRELETINNLASPATRLCPDPPPSEVPREVIIECPSPPPPALPPPPPGPPTIMGCYDQPLQDGVWYSNDVLMDSTILLPAPPASPPMALQYSYTWPHGPPSACCGGYYDDPGLRIVNGCASSNDCSEWWHNALAVTAGITSINSVPSRPLERRWRVLC